MPLTQWAPRSPDLAPCDFFLQGYVRDKIFIPPLSVDLTDLKQLDLMDSGTLICALRGNGLSVQYVSCN
ncbi:hypothetical protein TNCV_925871 [Trichonephila clavipes]|nr:hypothetical protein TNCV_925871 [Trichonephila clavipes]